MKHEKSSNNLASCYPYLKLLTLLKGAMWELLVGGIKWYFDKNVCCKRKKITFFYQGLMIDNS